MNKRKKIITNIIVLCLIYSVLTLVFLVYWNIPYYIFKTTKSNVTFSKQNNEISVNENNIKILQLTDLHINGQLDMPNTILTIKNMVYATKPDLVVLTGDIFSNGASKHNVESFLTFMEDINLPWAAVFGNHDDETHYSLSELSEKFENAKNSLFQTGNLSNLYGNYFYNIEFEDNKKFQLIFMDSRSSGFTEESVQFYRQTIESSKSINSGTALNNFTFFHIPVSEMSLAVKAYEENPKIGKGEINEELCLQQTDVGFFNSVLELNKTKALIWGHDHVNNAKILYNNVYMCYGTKTGTSSYNYMRMKGGTLYLLNSDGSFSINDIFI